MSETIDVRMLGKLLRDVQAELRTANARTEAMFEAILKRVTEIDALSEQRFDAVLARLDQSERSLNERLERIEKKLERH